jgi:pimeloyl-ACP methyl ester carboxylesterase
MTSGMPDVPGVTHRDVKVNGVRIHVAEAGEGPPVLMLHGWPQHWYLWRGVIPLVAPHARAICPDFRGFGWSGVPDAGYEKSQLKRDTLAVLDALGVERFHVAGHDWGGYVAFLLALEDPDRVEGLLALNTLPPWPSREPATALDGWRFAYMPVLATPLIGGRLGRAGAARGLRDAGLGDADVDAFVSRIDGDRARSTEKLYRSFVLRELPALMRRRYRASDLKVPTRIVFGCRDPVVTTRAVKDAAAQTDMADLELVPDAGHFVVDEKPELVADRLLGLLSR